MTWQEELFELNQVNGRLTPVEVVQYAAHNVTSALHGQFIWDDAIAANRQRLDQARWLIRKVHITVTNHSEPTKMTKIRAFSHVNSDGPNVYRETTVILQDKKQELLDEILRSIRSWYTKHRAMLSAAEVRKVVQQELDSLFDDLEQSA